MVIAMELYDPAMAAMLARHSAFQFLKRSITRMNARSRMIGVSEPSRPRLDRLTPRIPRTLGPTH